MRERFNIRKAAAAALLTVTLAACGEGNATVSPTQTAKPSETPAPTMIVTPNESPIVIVIPTPAPSVEVTPTLTPEPEATPMPIQSIIEAKPVAVSANQLNSAAQKAYQSPVLQDNPLLVQNGFKVNVPDCENKALHEADKKGACLFVVEKAYETYSQSGDQSVYLFAKDAYDFAISSNGPYAGQKAELDAQLNKIYPQS